MKIEKIPVPEPTFNIVITLTEEEALLLKEIHGAQSTDVIIKDMGLSKKHDILNSKVYNQLKQLINS